MKKDNKYPKELEKLKENIRNIRKEKGFRSAESFAEALGISLKTVQGWENLDNGRWPDLVMMLNVCELTGYDLDSLLGRIQEPTHDIKFIHEKTGLSVEAIEKLIALKGTGMDEILSNMMEHKEIDKLLSSIRMAVDEAEMWWKGFLEVGMIKDLDDHLEISDFMASKQFLAVVDDVRKQYSDRYGNLLQRLPVLMHIRIYRDLIVDMINLCDSEEKIKEILSENKSLTDQQRKKIIELWRKVNNDELNIDEMTLADWLKFMEEARDNGEH